MWRVGGRLWSVGRGRGRDWGEAGGRSRTVSTTTSTITTSTPSSAGSHDGAARKIDASLLPPAPRVYPSTPDPMPIARRSQKDTDTPTHSGTDTASHSPYRTSEKPPPSFGPEHAWGVVTWGRKAGEWGKGVAGDRRKSGDDVNATNGRENDGQVGGAGQRGGKKGP